MRPFFAHDDFDQQVAAVAARQYGLVTRTQLIAIGVDRDRIKRRLWAGRLHRVHAGVYAVGHTAPRREAHWVAAVLACGAGALLSNRSAASLWCIREGESVRPDVTIPGRNGRRHPGITIHRGAVTPADAAVHLGIPVTSPARTLVDLARILDEDELTRAVREAQFRRLFGLAALHEALNRRPSRILRKLIADSPMTQNDFEDAFLKICDGHGLPRPRTQHRMIGKRMDFVWPDHHVVVETDGWEAHSTRAAFQADRTTSNTLQLAGHTILRFTSADVRDRPSAVARQLRAALRTDGGVGVDGRAR